MPERIDRRGEHKTQLKKNRQIILATQDICGICGAPVDKTLKAPDPLSPTIDHIIPIAKGGHPSDLANLQLAHRWCNRQKSDRVFAPGAELKQAAKNTPGVKNAPPAVSAAQQTGPSAKSRNQKAPGINPADVEPDNKNNSRLNLPPASVNRDAVDNDDLPLHADWPTVVW